MNIFPHLSAERLSNVYLVTDDQGTGVIIDPAHIDKEILLLLSEKCTRLAAALLTHRHANHTAGLGTLLKIYDFDVYSASREISGIPSRQLCDGEKLRIGDLDIEAIFVPGHSMDSIVYRINGSALFTGDTLHSGSVASTHSVFEKELLLSSIRAKLFPLPDNCLIYPGHGALSKLRLEKMFNQDLLESGMALFR